MLLEVGQRPVEQPEGEKLLLGVVQLLLHFWVVGLQPYNTQCNIISYLGGLAARGGR